jgi:hypothetical protein
MRFNLDYAGKNISKDALQERINYDKYQVRTGDSYWY